MAAHLQAIQKLRRRFLGGGLNGPESARLGQHGIG